MVTESQRLLEVEVVYAMPEEQVIVALRLPCGTSVREAVCASGLSGRFAELQEVRCVGIYGRIVALETELKAGDRVEIYRPLAADPKQARRRRAVGKPVR
jgi:uncharacterized protein